MQYIPLEKILFLDIETVPQTESLDNLPPELRFLWEEKFNTIKLRMPEKYETETTAEEGYKKVPVFIRICKSCLHFCRFYLL